MKSRLENVITWLMPGLGDVLWIAAFMSVLGMGPRLMNVDGDLGRHLTIGSYILDQGSIPRQDLFSHTMLGQPLTPHEWLSQAVFALAHRLMGLDGVILLCGVVIATSFWLVYRRARAESREVLAAALVTVLAMAASSLHWLSRPHLFTFLLLAAWMATLENMRRGRLGQWWRLPVLMLLWANLHGAFIAGFVTWALYGLGLGWDAYWRRFPRGEELHGHFWRYFGLGGVASLLVTLLNPDGLGLWATSFGYVGNRYLVGHTAEYLPPDFHNPSTWPFLLVVGLLVLLLGLQNRRMGAAQVLPAAAWLVMALYSVRNVPLFVIVSAPLLARAMVEWMEAHRPLRRALDRFYHSDVRLFRTEMRLHGFLWPVIAALLAGTSLLGGRVMDLQGQGNTFDPRVFPVAAVDWLEQNPLEGNMFNHFPWGGYLLYRSWPEQRVFIDGQTDFYGEALTRQYEQVITLSPGWQAVLDQYRVDWAILPVDGSLAAALGSSPAWQEAYRDDTAVIYKKNVQ